MAELNWTFEAQQWLEDIFEYIAQENPAAATKVVTGIYERAQVLIDFPESGYRYLDSSRDVRILLYATIGLRTSSKQTVLSTFWVCSMVRLIFKGTTCDSA